MVTHEKSPEIFVWISGVPKFVPSILPVSFFQLRSRHSAPERGASVSTHGTSLQLGGRSPPCTVWRALLHLLCPVLPRSRPGPLALRTLLVSKCLQYFNSVLQRIRSHYRGKSCSYYTGLNSACPLSETVTFAKGMSRDSGHPNSGPICDSSEADNLGMESTLISKGEY